MSILPVAATIAYRSVVALAVAGVVELPTAAYMVFGSGSRPYSADTDTALEQQFAQVVAECTATGPTVTVRGVLSGELAGERPICEVGVLASDGTLMARRVVAPKYLEPESEYEFELVFEY